MENGWPVVKAQLEFLEWLVEEVDNSYMYWESSDPIKENLKSPFFDRNQTLILVDKLHATAFASTK